MNPNSIPVGSFGSVKPPSRKVNPGSTKVNFCGFIPIIDVVCDFPAYSICKPSLKLGMTSITPFILLTLFNVS